MISGSRVRIIEEANGTIIVIEAFYMLEVIVAIDSGNGMTQ